MKFIVIILAFVGTMIAQWYGNFSGKLPAKGSFLGFSYDSIIVRAIVTQIEYLWILILINACFTLVFSMGYGSFKNFLSLAIIWLAMGPITALIFNVVVLKEKTTIVAFMGIFLVIIGSILVVAQKEIFNFFKK